MQKNKYQSYAAATQTVPKTKQIVMLYDGVIRFLQQAKDAITAKRIEDRYKALTKASDILMGMQMCLDFENGGDIAKILYGFYSSIDGRIFALHRTNSADECEAVIHEMKKMRDVWDEIDQGGSNAPMKSPAAPLSAPVPAASSSDQNIILSA